MRAVLAIGEGGNFLAAIKATAEWFPRRERALATSILNSGANIGAVFAPAIIPPIAVICGWRAAFIVIGSFGIVWLAVCNRRSGLSARARDLSPRRCGRAGIETVCLRIRSSLEEPKDPRMLVTYLSYRDFIELVRCSLFTNRVGHAVVYGASDNPVKWWDNTKAGFLGFRPRDSSVQFAERFPVIAPNPDFDDSTQRFQGGAFVLGEPMERNH